MDDIVASAQVVLEGVDKVSPAATSSIAALRQLAAAGEDVQRKLINAAQKHQQTLQALNQIYAQNQQAAQGAGTATVQAHNAVTQAVQAQTQAAKNVPPVLNAIQTAGIQVQKQLTTAFGTTAIEEFIRKSYMAFTSQEEAMRRVQLAVGSTDAETKQLHKDLQDLAAATGQTTEAMAAGFRNFQAGSGLQGGELKAAFRGVVEAADMAGVHIVDMSRVATTAMAQLHISSVELPQLMAVLGKAFAGMGSEALHTLPNIIALMQRLNIQGRSALAGTVSTIEALGKAIGDQAEAGRQLEAIVKLAESPSSSLGNMLSSKMQAIYEGGGNAVDIYEATMNRMLEVTKQYEGDFRGTQLRLHKMFDDQEEPIQAATNYLKMNDKQRKELIETMRKQYASSQEIDQAHADFIRESVGGTRKLVGEWTNLEAATGGFLDRLGATDTLNSTVEDLKNIRELLEWLDNFIKEHTGGSLDKGVKSGFNLGAYTHDALEAAGIPVIPYDKPQEHKVPLSEMWNLPVMAAGGVVTEPTLAMIGEAGPEAVVPVGGMRGADGGTQAERDAAEMWGRLHGLAGTQYKHVSLTGQLTQEELDKLLQAGMAGGGGPGGGGGGGGGDRGWGPGSGRSSSDSDTPKDGKPGDPKAGGPGAGGPRGPVDKDGKPLFPTPEQHPGGAAGIPGLPGSPSGPALTPEQRKAAAAPPAAPGPAASGGGSPYLAKERAELIAEINNDPVLKSQVIAMGYAENNKNPEGPIASLIDRARAEQHTIKQALRGAFYKTWQDGRIQKNARELNAKSQEVGNQAIVNLAGGADPLEGRTDQGMWTDPGHNKMHPRGAPEGTQINEYGRQHRLKKIGGEWFSDKVGTEKFVARDRARKAEYDAAHGGATPAVGGAPAGTLTSIEQVAGAPGGPSGPTLTHEQRVALGTGGSSEAGGGGGGGPEEASRVTEEQGKVAGIRRQAIDPRLKSALQYAAEKAGVHVVTTSGGQPSTGRAGVDRTGSHRHDHGRAADLDIVDENGKKLARDDPRRLKFIEEAAAAGAGGTGAGYMGDPLKVHVGITGSKAIVGEGLGAYAGNKAEREAVARGVARYHKDPDILSRREVAAKATSPDPQTRAEGRRQLVFLHGMGYGRPGFRSLGTPDQIRAGIDADMQRVAAANDQDLHVIPASGDNPNDQEKQLRAYLKEHPDAEVEGFSAGGYTLRRLKKDFPKAKFTELGTGKGGSDPRFPGVSHMKLPRAEAERAEAGKKAREAKAAPKPPPTVAKKEEPKPTKTATVGPVERTEHAGGTTTRATDAPKLAEGGIVNRPTQALVGEAGPEAIIPLDGGGSFGDLNLDNLLRQHADLQAHVNRNPIQVPIAEPQRLGDRRQPFGRMFEAARRKTEARRTAHDAPLDTGPM